MAKTFKELSKINWVNSKNNDKPSYEEIIVGCLQRIADSTELMAQNYLKLQSDNDYLRKRVNTLNKEVEHHKRSAAAYKGKSKSKK